MGGVRRAGPGRSFRGERPRPPPPPSPPGASAARRLSGETKKSPVTIRNCSACSGRCIEDLPSLFGTLEVRLENVQHGGGKGPGQVRLKVAAPRSESVRCVRREDQAEEDGVLHAPEVVLLELDVRELAAGVVDQLFREHRSAPEFVAHLRRGIGH